MYFSRLVLYCKFTIELVSGLCKVWNEISFKYVYEKWMAERLVVVIIGGE